MQPVGILQCVALDRQIIDKLCKTILHPYTSDIVRETDVEDEEFQRFLFICY